MFRLGQAYIFGGIAGVVTYAILAVVIGGDGTITSGIASICGFVVGGGVAYWVYTGNK